MLCHAWAVTAFSDWVLLARVVRPQGRNGELLCELHTDFPERFTDRTSVFLRRQPTETPEPCSLESHWLPTGRSAGRVVLKFQGVDTIAAAKALAGAEVLLPASERVQLDTGEFYISDLRGCVLVNMAGGDGPDELGTIADVHFATDTSGRKLPDAAPVLIVNRPNGDEILIPLANEFLQNPDLSNRRIEMRLPPGLVDVNG